MNKERLSELADVLQGIDEHEVKGKYNQNRYLHPCGSPSCIAGWAVSLFSSTKLETYISSTLSYDHAIFEEATRVLELSNDQAYELFQGRYSHITPPNAGTAAEIIRHLIKTGEVNWNKAEENYLNKNKQKYKINKQMEPAYE